MTPYSDDRPLTPRSDYSPVVRDRINRLLRDADRLFSLGNIRERCQQALIAFHVGQQPSPFADWGARLCENREYRFAHSLTLSYTSAKDEIVRWAKGCMGEYLLEEAQDERERWIEDFARMKIASRWYQMKDDDQAWRVFSQNVPYGEAGREKEIQDFFETLDRICILTDILTGDASEYGIEVDYSRGRQSRKANPEPAIVSASRQVILDRLQVWADKGDWLNGVTAEQIKKFLQTVLQQSEALWRLLENGRGDRVRIVWQNLTGYFADRGLLSSAIGAPALNKMFFGDNEGYSNIDKGRPSKGLMTADFESIVPLLDANLPRVADKK